jgi:hypothetical protein
MIRVWYAAWSGRKGNSFEATSALSARRKASFLVFVPVGFLMLDATVEYFGASAAAFSSFLFAHCAIDFRHDDCYCSSLLVVL